MTRHSARPARPHPPRARQRTSNTRAGRPAAPRVAESQTTDAILTPPKGTRPVTLADRLSHLFLHVAWESGHPRWESAVRTVARMLRGLAGAGLIERQRISAADGRAVHLIRVTALGQEALRLLEGRGPLDRTTR
jgi:hypothetical protein